MWELVVAPPATDDGRLIACCKVAVMDKLAFISQSNLELKFVKRKMNDGLKVSMDLLVLKT